MKLLFSVDVLFVCFVYSFICVEALPYKYLEVIQFPNCPHKNSCSRIVSSSFNERLCECDYEKCATFGDCCIDYAQPISRKTSRQTCMHYGNFTHQGIYVFNFCSGDYLGPDEVILQCMDDDFSDPLVSVPVTDTSSGHTYLNRYCAVCNGVSPESMKTWKLYFTCDDEDLDINDISWDDIKYDAGTKKWGYDKYGQFNPCKFVYDKPPSVSVRGRPCRSNLISTCSSDWNQSTNRIECDAYMAVVTDRASNAYKNPHCAICNNVAEKDLMCLVTDIIDKVRVDWSIALFTDIGLRYSEVVGVSRDTPPSCPRGQKFDPFFKKCRIVDCFFKGYKVVNDKCVKQ